MSASGIIGPFFFEKSVDTEVYNKMLVEEAIPELKRKRRVKEHWFQQDGAPPHTTRLILGLLHEEFDGKVIARGYPDMFDGGLA